MLNTVELGCQHYFKKELNLLNKRSMHEHFFCKGIYWVNKTDKEVLKKLTEFQGILEEALGMRLKAKRVSISVGKMYRILGTKPFRI